MAEAEVNVCNKSIGTIAVNKKKLEEKDSQKVPECAVCLQNCIHPARLPCNHVFCYLCVKGVANQSKRCPMCRQEIPADFLEKPQLIELDENQKESSENQEEYQWFYEGRNGWWKYDPRTNEILETAYISELTELEVAICGVLYIIDFSRNIQYKKAHPMCKRGWWQYDQRTSLELETSYKQGKRSCELLIAGFLYIADFGSMLQLRRNDHSRRRRIKRDLYNVPKKGVAGLKLNAQEEELLVREIRGAERPQSPINDNIAVGDGTNTPIPPSNTPQTPAGNVSGDATPLTGRSDQRSDSLHQVLEQMRSLVSREHLSLNSDQEIEDSIDDYSFSDFPSLQ